MTTIRDGFTCYWMMSGQCFTLRVNEAEFGYSPSEGQRPCARAATPEGTMDTPAEPPDDGDIEIEIDGSTLHVRGEIDAHSAPALGDALRTHSGNLDLDLAGVEFVDSSGLRVLIESHQLLEARGDRLTIVDPSPPVQRMFELSVVDEYLNIRRN